MTRRTHSPAMWAAALLTFGVTLLFVVVIGLSTGVGAAVYLPLGLGFAIVLAGLPVAYLWPGDGEDEEAPSASRTIDESPTRDARNG